MKTSLRRLRGFSFHHGNVNSKDRRDLRPQAQLDEFDQAYQDMHEMIDCYDSLLSAAAATANSAYEFSKSLQEMGACLEKTALNDNEESSKVLLMLGKVQFELQKLVDNYRSHIFQTIAIPSDSLLNELRTVEEMKRQCDEKRNAYDYMVTRQREKGRSKSGKGETFSMQQLQTAHDEYDEEETLFVFRMKSLKQGQSRSLLTQAARHHAAQMCFFKKALMSLEAIEPHVKMVTEKQHIHYHFSGLEDEDGDDDGDDDDDDSSDTHGDGELGFDCGHNDQENASTLQKSMELDKAGITFPQVASVETAKENLDRGCSRSISFNRDVRLGSQSVPIFAELKSDPIEKIKQMQPSSSRKFNTYVLPTPVATKVSNSLGPCSPVPHPMKSRLSGHTHNLWHSSPLDQTKFDKSLDDEKFSKSSAQFVLRENSDITTSTQMPPPLADGIIFSHPPGASDYKIIKRQSFSGPITGIPSATKPVSKEHPQLLSGPILRIAIAQPPTSSLKISPSASPTFMSSPKISELHELPRPPASSFSESSKPIGLIGHSAPLMSKIQMPCATNRSPVLNAASQSPTPPQAITRSFSIPTRGHRKTDLDVSKPQNLGMASPPLSPITLTNKKSSSTGSRTVAQVVEITETGAE
ncbi:uncharacterized protein At2g33490-like [Mangifera indica]|uniref:uncharacterized protein At2g33490-like n=1 Tax=Mangifera indica TaxID=29780 RepID=UPI001CF9BF9D|nr:uncharacterized protein At2g33490-like [Mangifera indica]